MPSISDDGRYVAFVGDKIWRMDIDGGNLRMLTSGMMNYFPCFSPDGQWIVYQQANPDQRDNPNITLWKVPSDGGQPEPLTHSHSTSPAISPDGKLIAYLVGG